MKKVYLLITVSAIASLSIAQVPAYDTGIINTNAVSALYTADGTQNFKPTTGLPAYFVPKDSAQASIFCGALWVGGLDAGSQLHIAGQTYHQKGTDFWPGPIMTTYSTHEDTVWNHVWLIYKSTIDSFRAGKFGSNIPASIANWPGNGDVALGEAATLAPYEDSNHNGTYDPAGGDYPLIRGDEALYTIFNDARNVHTETGGTALGIEVHFMVYQFNSADTAIDEATFLHYDIYNRSNNNYNNVYFGNWIDMEVGNGDDNLIGCDSANNYWYAYCGHAFNANGSLNYTGEKGYHSIPPAQSLAYLCDTMTHFLYFNNDATVQGNPNTPTWYYNYMENLWGDGTHTTYGGSGYGGATPTNYMYSGNPLTGTGWVDNSVGDVRGISSTGPYTFMPGAIKSLDLALVFSQSFPGNNLGSVALAGNYVSDIKNFYNAQSYGCDDNLLTGVPAVKSNAITPGIFVYPNPTNGVFTIQSSAISGQWSVEVYNMLGEKVYNATLLQPQTPKGALSEIDLSNQPNGIYFYRALTVDGKLIGSGKIAKQ